MVDKRITYIFKCNLITVDSKYNGMHLPFFYVGVGPHVNIRALTEIASLPKKDNLFLLDALDWPTSFLPSLHSSC